MILAAKYAREHNIPYFGICLGMQIAVVEYARHVAGIADRVGSLEPGKDADIVLFEGNPLREIGARPRYVIVDGKVVVKA